MRRSIPITFLFGLCPILLGGCTAHLLSTKVPISPASSASELDGLFYTLPQTVVTVKLPFSVTKVKPGKHEAYKDLFFPDVPAAKPQTALGSPEFSVQGIADPRQVYVVKATGRGTVKQTLTFGFQEDGVVTGAKTEVENITGDLIISGVKALTGIATRMALVGSANIDLPSSGGKDLCSTIEEKKDRRQAEKALSQEKRRAFFIDCVLAKEFGQLDLNFRDHDSITDQDRWVSHYFDDLKLNKFLSALATYLEIYQLIEGRHRALVQADGGLKQDVILAQNKARVSELMQRFVGVSQKSDWTGHFDLLPSECDTDRDSKCTATWTSTPLISYVPGEGLCGFLSANHRGKVPSKSMNASSCAMKQDIVLTLEPNSAQDQLAFRLADNFTPPSEAGLYFIVPLNANVQLVKREAAGGLTSVPGGVQLEIAQRGIVAALPSEIGGKAFTHDITYHQSSGALKSYTLDSAPLVDKGAVDSLSGSLNDLLDARNEQREETTNAGLNVLKRETEALELLVRQQEACAKLPNPPDNCENL